MNMIFKVARTEIKTLFYSPIAWFLMVVFLIQCALAYLKVLDYFTGMQERGGPNLDYLAPLTFNIFSEPRGGMFNKVMQNLYLYIPLLTMGLISREINGGTIKLLYSSPVKVSEIIFGKYLAMVIYSLVLIGIVGIFIVAGAFHISGVDYGLLVSAVLGFFLLLCAYSAIGLFMSCLTTYQVVAAVSTFVMIGILSYIGTLWQEYDFFRDITYFLSLSGRTNHMLNGLITTKDLIYFLIIIYIFLGLSIYKLRAGRESKSALFKAGRYVGVVLSALVVGYISSRPGMIGYLDTTAGKTNTLSPQVQKIVKDFGKDELEVTLYNNLLDNYSYLGMPSGRNRFLAMWERYVRFKPDIKFNYVMYYDEPLDAAYMMQAYKGKSLKEIAEMNAKSSKIDLSRFKTPEEISKVVDLKPELNRFVMQLKYKDKTTFLRIFKDMMIFPSETEFSAAFKRLQQARIPKIAFLSGNLERSINKSGDREYENLTNLKTFRHALINQGFDVDTISVAGDEVPAWVSTLVIADPKTDLPATTLSAVQRYIDKGGNLLIMGEPGKQQVLNPLLKQFGVQLIDGVVAQPSSDLAPDLVLNALTPQAATFTRSALKIYADTIPVSTPGVTGLTYSTGGAYTIKPLLVTSKDKSWLKKGKMVADSADIVFSPQDGDEKISLATALSLTRKVQGKEQRVVITGDADLMSNSELRRYNVKTSNFVFNTAVFSWLSYGEFPIDASRPDAKDNRLLVSSEQVSLLNILFVWVLPALVLVAGSILLIRRKRK
ncbi:Gldg family protein [Pedobacter faecalis]|uniref:Gldg family protein n=1 Tax=Pedobacter faecalis TaxID=3041495 RepID=UPI0025500681|nr:Gldg family protein [Pedobacter sp. ELA7]